MKPPFAVCFQPSVVAIYRYIAILRNTSKRWVLLEQEEALADNVAHYQNVYRKANEEV